MSRTTRVAFGILFGLAASADASAGVSDFTINGAGNFSGENWAYGNTWTVRAILLDATLQPVGKLSAPETFYTLGQAVVPAGVSVTLDADAPAGSVIRIYRATAPFEGGDTGTEYADYTGYCPCTANVAVTVNQTGRLPDSDFSAAQATLPVRLQSFEVD